MATLNSSPIQHGADLFIMAPFTDKYKGETLDHGYLVIDKLAKMVKDNFHRSPINQ